MHPRNLHLYFFSPTGGTQRVAGLFAENLNAADACTDITVRAETNTFSADISDDGKDGGGLYCIS